MAVLIVAADTITVSHFSELGDHRWWHLSGKNPKLVFGFDSFSYQEDTVIAMDACGDYFVRSRRFFPLATETQEYLMSDCFNSESVYAEVRADSIYYQQRRGCPDTPSFRTILPGTGIVAGEERSLWGDVSYRLKQFDPPISGR
ncbi:MAG: hypothetical protein WBP42_03810 [Candidatus Zixiibacteriota bacterium]